MDTLELWNELDRMYTPAIAGALNRAHPSMKREANLADWKTIANIRDNLRAAQPRTRRHAEEAAQVLIAMRRAGNTLADLNEDQHHLLALAASEIAGSEL